jgi:hypothetical protein
MTAGAMMPDELGAERQSVHAGPGAERQSRQAELGGERRE